MAGLLQDVPAHRLRADLMADAQARPKCGPPCHGDGDPVKAVGTHTLTEIPGKTKILTSFLEDILVVLVLRPIPKSNFRQKIGVVCNRSVTNGRLRLVPQLAFTFEPAPRLAHYLKLRRSIDRPRCR